MHVLLSFVWNSSKFVQATRWSQADFNANGVVDVTDFNIWQAHKFTASAYINTEVTAHQFGFTGRMFDTATGLQNNLNRWYDPVVGRWISEDPIGFEAGDSNLYRYVGNGPTIATDPSGLQEAVVVAGGAGTAIGGIGTVVGKIGTAVGSVGGAIGSVGGTAVGSAGAVTVGGVVIVGGGVGYGIGWGMDQLGLNPFPWLIGGATELWCAASNDALIEKANQIQGEIDRLRKMLGEATTAPRRNEIADSIANKLKELNDLFN